MSLQDEIDHKSKEIQTDSYAMSIGELMNMYKDGELQIQPDFQRLFRWSPSQKARFIESILLGIPIPPIFVAQTKGGVWDVIDGVQRLSTIFEFTGILKDTNGNPVPPTQLEPTKFLPSLGGKMWMSDDTENSFTNEQRIDFKRAKMDINIIKRSSDADAKYEMFQRLNTGGTGLEEQEIRNCLMIMVDKSFYSWVSELKNMPNFRNCLPLTDKQLKEQEDMEYVVRFLVYRYVILEQITGREDMGEFLTEQMLQMIEDPEYDREHEHSVFVHTFQFLDELLGEDSFKKYDPVRQKFKGAVSISAFEAIIIGVSENIEKLTKLPKKSIVDKIQKLYQMENFQDAIKPGTRATNRFKKLAMISKEVFRV